MSEQTKSLAPRERGLKHGEVDGRLDEFMSLAPRERGLKR